MAKESTIEIAAQTTTVEKALPIALPQTTSSSSWIAIAIVLLLLKHRGLD
ncbi:MAG: hypothetical protein QW438_03245 [Ignisphaera sp.]